MSGRDEYPNENALEKAYWENLDLENRMLDISQERDELNRKTLYAFLDAYLVPDEETRLKLSRNLTEEEKAYVEDEINMIFECLDERDEDE